MRVSSSATSRCRASERRWPASKIGMANWTTAAQVPDGCETPVGVRYAGAKLAVPAVRQPDVDAARQPGRRQLARHLEDGFARGVHRAVRDQQDAERLLRPPQQQQRRLEQYLVGRRLLRGAQLVETAAGSGLQPRAREGQMRPPVLERARVHADLPVLVDDVEIGPRHRQGDLPSRLVAADTGDGRLIPGLRRLRPPGRGQDRVGHLGPEGRLRLRLGDLSLKAAFLVQDGRRHGAVDRRQEDTAGALQDRLGTQDRLCGPRRVRTPLGRDAHRVVEGDGLSHRRRGGDRRHLGG